MRYLTIAEVIRLHAAVVADTGGAKGVRDLGALESAVAQPRMTMGGVNLYGTIEEKAAALCYSLVLNHPFEDGNKRIGHGLHFFSIDGGQAFEAKRFDISADCIDGSRAYGCVRQSFVTL